MHYHKRKVDGKRPIHADYTYVPQREVSRLIHCEVGKPEEWLQCSDHMPMLAEFELSDGSAFLASPQKTGRFSFLTKEALAMSTQPANIVQCLWNYCNVLRDDGVSYCDYVDRRRRQAVLKRAFERRLVLQDPNDKPADMLLE